MELMENRKMDILIAFLLVALGGAIGAVLRYAVIKVVDDSQFPWAIFIVNIIGCTLASFLLFRNIDEMMTAFLIVGILGAFTTLSAFTNNTVVMLYDQEYLKFCLNVLLNVGVCLIGAIIGRYLALAL